MEVTGSRIDPSQKSQQISKSDQAKLFSPRFSMNTIAHEPLKMASAYRSLKSANRNGKARDRNNSMISQTQVKGKDFITLQEGDNFKTQKISEEYHISIRVKKELKIVYKDPESAYASLDFTGIGRISMKTFLDNIIVQRLKIPQEDLIQWLCRDKIFLDPFTEIDFQQFKKKFFPNYFLIEDINEYELNGHQKNDNILSLNDQQDQRKKAVLSRLHDLEEILKTRFQNNWVTVRRAFLDLDYDHDGFITSQDIIRYFGQASKDIDFNDLTKLIKDKDSKRKGTLSYADFSRWMGVAIHQSEGFYFRHDSIKNPPYEENLMKKYEQRVIPKKSVLNVDVEKTVIDKIHFQWKTLKKAFIDLNKEKTGCIMPQELKNYLKHWGLYLDEIQFQHIFNKFDADNDGKITYEDFQNTLGNEINPPEHLYFRQDIRRVPKPVVCINEDCLQPPSSMSEYCQMHVKMMQNKGFKIVQKLQTQLGKRWTQFMYNLRRNCDKEDENLILMDQIVEILSSKFGIKISEDDIKTLIIGFPAKSSDTRFKINISHFFQFKNTSTIKKIYKKIDLEEEQQEDSQFVDMSGYLGLFYRKAQKTLPITQEQFLDLLLNDNKFASVMRCIKDIDKDNNGYVTNQELDDILKLIYPQELGDKDLKKLFRKFASIQNTILIDYKKLRSFIVQEMQKRELNKTQVIVPKTILDPKFISQEDRSLLIRGKNKPIEVQNVNYVTNQIKSEELPIFKYEQSPPKKILQSQLIEGTQQSNQKEQKLKVNASTARKKSILNTIDRDKMREEIRAQLMSTYTDKQPKSRDATPLRKLSTGYARHRFNNLAVESEQNKQSYNQTLQDIKKSPYENQLEDLGNIKLQTIQVSSQGYTIQDPQKLLIKNEPNTISSNHSSRSRSNLRTSQGQRQTMKLSGIFPLQKMGQTEREILVKSIKDQRLMQSENRIDDIQTEISSQRKPSTISELRRILGNRKASAVAVKRDLGYFAMKAQDKLNNSQIIRQEVDTKAYQSILAVRKGSHLTSETLNHNKFTFSSSISTTSKKHKSLSKFQDLNTLGSALKQKLAYEWKNVYRQLSQDEQQYYDEGMVDMSKFEKALNKHKVNLSKEELHQLYLQFGEEKNKQQLVNYTRISKAMGMHNNTLELIRPTTSSLASNQYY